MRIPAAIALCLVLAACDNSDEDDERTATGQVLEGTISDSMLPLDTVRSQPPRAQETGATGAGGATPDPEATDAAEEDEESPAEDEAAPEDEEG